MTSDTASELARLIAGGEGVGVELKRSLNKDIGRGLCAFANAGGGTVLLGVSDDGKVVGVADHNRLKARVSSTARSADPPIEVEVESVGDVLRVVVPPQKRKPYSFGGRFFMRDGASSRQMSNSEVEELFYAAGRLHFDRKPCPDFSLENDLDDETWARFSRRAKIPESMDRMVALRNLGLLDSDDRMTHAGAWLLARDIRRFTTSAQVSCALFMGTEKVRILDRRDFHGDVPAMVDDAVAWILTKINVEFVIRHVRREERPELPEEALREAVANAVAHRDYRSTANVQIYVFKDRIEIVSPGGLPAGMSEADLGVKSMPRNPLLFGMLYRMDVVENIGSGIKRIRGLCREQDVADPVIDASEHWVTVTFPRPANRNVEDAGSSARRLTPEAEGKAPESTREAQEDRQEAQDGNGTAQEPGKEAQDDGMEAQEDHGQAQDHHKEAQDSEQETQGDGGQAEAARQGRRAKSGEGRLQDWEIAVLRACAEQPATGRELLAASGYTTRTGNFKRAVERYLAMNLLELTIPDKPRSGRQRYRLTAAGRRALAGLARGRQ